VVITAKEGCPGMEAAAIIAGNIIATFITRR
jgi:hypothetical protein